MKSTISRALSVAMIAGLAVSAMPGVSLAGRSVVAFAGRAQNPADDHCFTESFGTMTNACNNTTVFIIPLMVDIFNAGSYSATVTAVGRSSGNNVECATYGVNKDGTLAWGGDYVALNGFGSARDITSSAFAPTAGAIYVGCIVHPGGRLNVVNW